MTETPKGRIRLFFDTKLVQPILSQLKQGTSPEKLALSCALGATLSVFPIFGGTTLLCVAVAQWKKLNLPAMIAINYLITPVHLLFIPFAIYTGEKWLDLPHITFNPATIAQELFASPGPFFAHYGLSTLAGILVWVCMFPVFTYVLYRIFLILFRRKVAPA